MDDSTTATFDCGAWVETVLSYGRHDVSEDDIAAVVDVLRGDWLTTGPAVERFEEHLTEWTGGVPAVAVSSGTAALHAAFVAAGIGPGDEVVTPPITFIATQATAHFTGAQVVFADVEPDTANIDPAAVEAAITPRTAAIVAVDYAGHPADLFRLRDIAHRHGLLLIEDAAHSLGSTLNGQAVGSIADITTFSFFATKNITTGEGGAICAKDSSILTKARTFSRQGLVRDPSHHIVNGEGPWHQEVHEFGLNYRLPDVLAALGIKQLSRIQAFKSRRAHIKTQYDSRFREIDGIDVPIKRPGADPMWHLYPLQVPAHLRATLFAELLDAGIRAQVNYLPAYRHPVFGLRGNLCPQAENFYSREISLPIHMRVADADIDRISETVIQALR